MSAERLACRTCPARAVSVNTTDDAVSFSFCVETFSPTENINGIPAKKILTRQKNSDPNPHQHEKWDPGPHQNVPNPESATLLYT